MESKANIKMVRVAPRKARLVIDLIRSKQVEEAFHILDGTPNKASFIVKKLLNSAVANATHNHGMTFENLFVKVILVNEGPTIKRFHPRARGRAMEILKRTSHISVVVSDDVIVKGSKAGKR